METLTVNVKGVITNKGTGKTDDEIESKFIFKATPNQEEAQRIKNNIASFLGGWQSYYEFESVTEQFYSKFVEKGKGKLGEEFDALYTRYLDLIGEVSKEAIEEKGRLFERLNNRHYADYFRAKFDLAYAKNYVEMKELCIEKPSGFKFEDKSKEVIMKLWGAYTKEKRFFREKAGRSEEVAQS